MPSEMKLVPWIKSSDRGVALAQLAADLKVYQENIREMIDWFERHWISKSTHEDGTFEFLISDWQAFKKWWEGK